MDHSLASTFFKRVRTKAIHQKPEIELKILLLIQRCKNENTLKMYLEPWDNLFEILKKRTLLLLLLSTMNDILVAVWWHSTLPYKLFRKGWESLFHYLSGTKIRTGFEKLQEHLWVQNFSLWEEDNMQYRWLFTISCP